MGDIHGCFEELQALLQKASYDRQKHRLILLGDMIGRGPLSFEVLQWARKRSVEALMGNHEMGFLRAVQKGLSAESRFKGLKAKMSAGLEDWISWLKRLPFYIEDRDFIAVHAGLVPGEAPGESDPRLLALIRNWDPVKGAPAAEGGRPWHEFYKGRKPVVYGHWAKQGLALKDNSLGMDSGCVYGGALSGVFLPSRRIVQTKALRQYAAWDA